LALSVAHLAWACRIRPLHHTHPLSLLTLLTAVGKIAEGNAQVTQIQQSTATACQHFATRPHGFIGKRRTHREVTASDGFAAQNSSTLAPRNSDFV
jgi:hypothetical protein